MNSNFYKSILWGDTEALNNVDIQLRNSYVITTKLISIDGSNYLNEIVFLLNNDKQNYTLKFNEEILNNEKLIYTYTNIMRKNLFKYYLTS